MFENKRCVNQISTFTMPAAVTNIPAKIESLAPDAQSRPQIWLITFCVDESTYIIALSLRTQQTRERERLHATKSVKFSHEILQLYTLLTDVIWIYMQRARPYMTNI